MKQRDLLLAGLLLFGVPAFVHAQPNLADPNSAEVVFEQPFEADWNTWTTTPVDQITKLQYMDGKGHSNSPSGWKDFKKIETLRDSVMTLYNGVVVIDDGEKAKGKEHWREDDNLTAFAKIINDNSPERAADFALYGENGGDYYFQFTSDTTDKQPSNSNAYSNKLSARYRRNLFVRLTPGAIKENSSYRLTFYVKAKKVAGHEGMAADPTIYADVMRGYYHSEKPFSMGDQNDANNNKFDTKFEYTKNDFYADRNWDNWEKVTFMTYYTTDSIAERYMYHEGYYWADDSAWIWKKEVNPTKDLAEPYDLHYIVQPNKFFVRIGFASDYTQFSIDNLSLTKSWIAGAEYYGDKMRINFGYKTNLGQLVAEEKVRSGVDQLELPANYFKVWCLKHGGNRNTPADWMEMQMRSAEYHGDGYLYLFTKYYDSDADGIEDTPFEFGDYDEVLVSFTNPKDDPKMALKYTDRPFPKGNDSTWIKGGKYVPDFVNEVAQKNPSQTVWKGVYSKFDLPPVAWIEPFEDGSFGLEPVKQLKYKFSRKVVLNDPDPNKLLHAYVGEEEWNVAYDANNDSIIVLTRPGGQNLPNGDYQVMIVNVYGEGTDKGEDVVRNYNFGSISRELPPLTQVWDAKFYDLTINSGTSGAMQPAGTAVFSQSNQWGVGTGTNDPTKAARLYTYTSVTNYPALLCLSPRGKAASTARLYLGYGDGYKMSLTGGNYTVNFDVVGCNKIKWFKVYLYPWDADPKTLGDNAKQVLCEQTNTANFIPESVRNNQASQIDTMMQSVSLGFIIANAGDYIIEIETQQANGSWGDEWSNYSGIMLSNVTVDKAPISYGPIKSLNAAVDNAKKRVASIEGNLKLYGGALYNQVKDAIKFYDYDPEGDFKDPKKGYPNVLSEWTKGTNMLNDLSIWLVERKDTIDAFRTKTADANTKLSSVDAAYMQLAAYKKLQEKLDSAASASFNVPDSSGVSINALTDRIDKAMTALDDRIKMNDALKDGITAADKAIAEASKADLPEYKSLQDTLARAKQFDAINSNDSLLKVETARLSRATVRYTSKIVAADAQTARLKGLRKLAHELGSDPVNFWALNNFVDTTQTDNDEIANIYKEAIKLSIYERTVIDPTSLDGGIMVTPFIKNFNLYATINGPIVDNSDLELPNSRNDAKAKAKNNPGSTIMKIGHQWGQNDLDKKIWVLMYDTAYADVFPGWTVQSFITDNHSMVTPDATARDNKYSYLSAGVQVFDGAVTMDWNSKAQLKTTIVDLPAGLYALGVSVPALNADGSHVTSLTATSKVGDNDVVKSDSRNSDGATTMLVDSIVVLDGKIDVDFILQSQDGGSQADNFTLEFIAPLDETEYDVSYDDSLDVISKKLDNMIKTRKTLVNTPKAAAASVEYYTVGGQKLVAPRRGEIIIRKTTQANGKVVVEKIILK